ncbi:MAG: hypothetical protein AAF614_25970 [Chloroflexota bacterium]
MVGNPFANQGLPHLVQYIDPICMQARFEAFLQTNGSSVTVEACRLEKVSFRPDKHCSILFRVYLDDGSESWFFTKMYAVGKGQQRYEKERRKDPTVAFWSDWDTLVWTFPHDVKLPQLARLLEPRYVAQLVEQNAHQLSLAPDAVCHQVQCKQVKYVPGKRCVLRFEVEAGEGAQQIRFFSKTFSNEQSRYVYEQLQSVCATLGTGAGQFEIPPLLGHIDGLHTFWQAEWPGEPMARLYYQDDWADVLPAVAEGLAAFHLSKIAGLRVASYLDEIVSEVVGDAEWIAHFVPSVREQVLGLVARIADLELVIAEAKMETAVPIHGAFRMSQLLHRLDDDGRQRIAMIDLDAIASGDPHYDVAEFMASTLYQYFHRDLALPDLIKHADNFSRFYAAHVPWKLDGRLLAWYIAASLVGKLRGSFKRIQFTAIAKTEDLFSLVTHYLDQVEEDEGENAPQQLALSIPVV